MGWEDEDDDHFRLGTGREVHGTGTGHVSYMSRRLCLEVSTPKNRSGGEICWMRGTTSLSFFSLHAGFPPGPTHPQVVPPKTNGKADLVQLAAPSTS